MSKQQTAKDAQGYHTQPRNCALCKHRTSELVLPDWMQKNNERGGSERYSLAVHGQERRQRCGLGGFAIKKTASCLQWEASS